LIFRNSEAASLAVPDVAVQSDSLWEWLGSGRRLIWNVTSLRDALLPTIYLDGSRGVPGPKIGSPLRAQRPSQIVWNFEGYGLAPSLLQGIARFRMIAAVTATRASLRAVESRRFGSNLLTITDKTGQRSRQQIRTRKSAYRTIPPHAPPPGARPVQRSLH